jgi:hypothetical protein
VKRTAYVAAALALAVTAWPLCRIGAAPRCYPDSRFVALSGGLVRDTLTRLVWQQRASDKAMKWADAQTHCSSTGSGFRLPTVKELRSIVDYGVAPPGPTIDQTAFPGTPSEWFWTSSPVRGSSGYAWTVSFIVGYSADFAVDNVFRVRCVHN